MKHIAHILKTNTATISSTGEKRKIFGPCYIVCCMRIEVSLSALFREVFLEQNYVDKTEKKKNIRF